MRKVESQPLFGTAFHSTGEKPDRAIVTELQRLLTDLGYGKSIVVDGEYTLVTHAALDKLGRQNQMTLGPNRETLEYLRSLKSSLTETGSPITPTQIYSVRKQGSSFFQGSMIQKPHDPALGDLPFADSPSMPTVTGPYGAWNGSFIAAQQSLLDDATGLNSRKGFQPTSDPQLYFHLRSQKRIGYLGNVPEPPGIVHKGKKYIDGWKLHIGVQPDQAGYMAVQLLPVLRELSVAHKLIDQVRTYATDTDANQYGKFFTILPPSKEELVSIAKMLDSMLCGSAFIPTAVHNGDQRIGRSGFLSVRYGSFNQKEIWDPRQRTLVTDDYTKPYPDWKRDELKELIQLLGS